ncbi:MAG: hypothetical protein AAGA56_30255 [Myxococcota bacterium]
MAKQPTPQTQGFFSPPAENALPRNLKAVVVDEDARRRSLIAKTLRKTGQMVATANDESKALELAMRHRPHFMIFAARNPSSHRLLEENLRDSMGQDAPPIVVVCQPDQELEGDGAVVALTEPVDETKLLDVVTYLASAQGWADGPPSFR